MRTVIGGTLWAPGGHRTVRSLGKGEVRQEHSGGWILCSGPLTCLLTANKMMWIPNIFVFKKTDGPVSASAFPPAAPARDRKEVRVSRSTESKREMAINTPQM